MNLNKEESIYTNSYIVIFIQYDRRGSHIILYYIISYYIGVLLYWVVISAYLSLFVCSIKTESCPTFCLMKENVVCFLRCAMSPSCGQTAELLMFFPQQHNTLWTKARVASGLPKWRVLPCSRL